MAVSLTATVSVNNSAVLSNQGVNGVLTIQNTGTTPTNILSVQMFTGNQLTNGGAGSVALPSLNFNGPGVSTTVAAISGVTPGVLNIPFDFTTFSGLQPTLTASSEFTFPLTAYVLTSDGSITTASTATVQSNPIQGYSQAPGQFPYTPTSGPLSASTATIPQPGQYPNPPVQGQLRMDSNLESGLAVTVL